ncbi:MAG: hypothetical protein H0U74_19130 [Bradymonadaceae bacterium]|nr:hypothetical protein [Lujinxingiaceae bacterium]
MNERVFRYQPHIRWMQYATIALLGLGATGSLLWTAAVFVFDGVLLPGSALNSLFLGLSTLMVFWLHRTLATTSIHLTERAVRYRTHKHDVTLRFDQIERIQFPSIRFTGGWLKIVSGKETIRLTVVLKDIHELVVLLKDGLDAHSKGDTYDAEKLFSFYKTCAFSSQSWERLYENAGPLVVTNAALAGLWFTGPSLMPEFYGSGGRALYTLTLSLAALGVLPVGYVIADLLCARRLNRTMDRASFKVPNRNRAKERTNLFVGVGLAIMAWTALASTLLH